MNTPIKPLTYVEIDLSAIKHNLKELERLSSRQGFLYSDATSKKIKAASQAKILTVVKAGAYGHGMEEVSRFLQGEGVDFFAVSDLNEGARLRRSEITQQILLLESTLASQAKDIIEYHLTPTICTLELAKALNAQAKKLNEKVSVHIKVDTGMGRFGVAYDEAYDFIRQVSALKYLTIEGIYTHFPLADTDGKFTVDQIECLRQLVGNLKENGIIIPFVHASNSMGLVGYNTDLLNLSRPGLMLYGLYPHPSVRKKVHLKPALAIKSTVIFLKELKKGQGVSYGHTFLAKKNLKTATISIGYSDGYFRAFSNKAEVLIDGLRCPILGNVTMDQIVVDVTKIKNPYLGMPVIILGTQKNQTISADELARHAGTINYEIVCNLGNRLPRVYI